MVLLVGNAQVNKFSLDAQLPYLITQEIPVYLLNCLIVSDVFYTNIRDGGLELDLELPGAT